MSEPTQAASSPDVRNDDVDLLDLLQVVADNLRLLIAGPFLAGLVALCITYAVDPTFTATTRFMPPLQQQSSTAMALQNLGALGGLAGAATGLKNPNDQFIGLVGSESVANALIDQFKLVSRYEVDFKEDARLRLSKLTRVTAGKDNLITIEVGDKDPGIAAQMANASVGELAKLLSRLAITEAQQRRVFFEKQLVKTQQNLAVAESALSASGVNSSAAKSSPEVAIKAVAETQARIAAQEVKLSTMRGYLTESSPDFKLALNELYALRAQLGKAESSAAGSVPANGANSNYIARLRDVKYNETLNELFTKQFELAKADEAREGPVIQIVDVAVAPERRSKPKRAHTAILVSLVSGMLLLLFVYVRQGLRGAYRAPENAAKISSLQTSLRRAVGRG